MLQLMEESVSESRQSKSTIIHVCCLCGVSTCVSLPFDSVPFPQGTLKEHFKKCDSGFDHILESLKQSFLAFGKKQTDMYEVRNKLVSKNKILFRKSLKLALEPLDCTVFQH